MITELSKWVVNEKKELVDTEQNFPECWYFEIIGIDSVGLIYEMRLKQQKK